MRAIIVRCQHEATVLCIVCSDILTQIMSHAGHHHTPWL